MTNVNWEAVAKEQMEIIQKQNAVVQEMTKLLEQAELATMGTLLGNKIYEFLVREGK